MYAILGRIIAITPTETGALAVRLAPRCLLPARSALPRALRGVEILVMRTAADAREIGVPGDSLVLSAAESRPWLAPLPVAALENAWCRVEISPLGGGTVLGWQERGRAAEHFSRPDSRIGHPFDAAGHNDCYQLSWHLADRMRTLTLYGMQHRADGSLVMDGLIDRRLGLRTTVTGLLHDDVPLLVWRRTFRIMARRRRGDIPRDTIDAVHSFGLGFRAVWPAERGAVTGSRLLCGDGTRLLSLRSPEVQRDPCYGWTAHGGWLLVEHPARRHAMLYLLPPSPQPGLTVVTGLDTLAVEPAWPMRPLRPGEDTTLALAIAAGECCGAGPDGAWVGCRTPRPGGGVRCAVITRAPVGEATVTLGHATQRLPLSMQNLPDIGPLGMAVADFPAGALEDPLRITAAGLPQREAP